MGRTFAGIMAAVMVAAGPAGCGEPGDPTPMAASVPDRHVVSHRGLAGIEFGDSRAELERDHGLVRASGDCGPRLPSYPDASPIFEDDRLVLLWADPPLRTPEGIAVGDLVSTVHDTHLRAEPLTAPPERFRFDGLLVTSGDRAYLFLHDGATVQKLIVGYEDHVRRLFHEGFGTC
jgi:hypothetical protein